MSIQLFVHKYHNKAVMIFIAPAGDKLWLYGWIKSDGDSFLAMTDSGTEAHVPLSTILMREDYLNVSHNLTEREVLDLFRHVPPTLTL